MRELVTLLAEEDRRRAHVDEVGRAARQATADLADAREALADVERRIAAGEAGAQARTKAERRLATAEQGVGVRWPERRQGAERAARDARQAVQVHISRNFDELISELEEAGAAAAEQVDYTAQSFLAAAAQRAAAERNLIEITALVRPMGPNDVARAASDEAVYAVSRFVERGGEVAPALRIERVVPA
jgi:hypothetical protein